MNSTLNVSICFVVFRCNSSRFRLSPFVLSFPLFWGRAVLVMEPRAWHRNAQCLFSLLNYSGRHAGTCYPPDSVSQVAGYRLTQSGIARFFVILIKRQQWHLLRCYRNAWAHHQPWQAHLGSLREVSLSVIVNYSCGHLTLSLTRFSESTK